MDRLHILTTPLEKYHLAIGAKMTEFSGWKMPVSYSGITSEHLAVRESVGVFDVSHLGRLLVSGAAAAATLGRILTLDVSRLAVNTGAYCLILNSNAGIEEDLIALRQANNEFLLLVNAGNRAKVIKTLESVCPESGTSILDTTFSTVMLAIQGPRCPQVLDQLGIQIGDLPRYGTSTQVWRGADLTVARSGYTGELGYEVIVPAKHGERLFREIVAAGAGIGILPCGLGARDTLRTEMGYPLWGNDIDPDTSPDSAGLLFAVDAADHEFLGKASLLKQMTRQTYSLSGLSMDSGIARRGDRILLPDGSSVPVTSGTFSPSLKRGIALAYLPLAANKFHSVQVEVRGKLHTAEIVGRPIYRFGGVNG